MTEKAQCSTPSTENEWRTEAPEASQTMFFWADRMLQIKDEMEAVDLELKRLKNVFDNAERTLFDMMVNQQVDQFKRQGYSFSPTIKKRASILSEHKEQAMEWLRNSDYADIVKETVHPQTLTSLVKEWSENGITDDIAPFYEMLNIYDDQKISMKRG
jgi:hypothetical protein